ncbi:bifunctional phosphopantothenoylcysteine decarboxylase/phosphopantothenate--cysteine ligase CoaBC [Xanthocytophaga agilis]|uniref:Coenzyme A biosynthesis bifunctional protein CoaBC n=1 Tax=Xanthocytophaga agilis TaxID=3048010 RepID=A0AAE3R4T1_9BACT|nr:bifunctional phosphopantothenoylcysteine decarboxylase/phosphopantothenate--cysteine ligase CoaBC [Xanthocytophaga agilis]MDJ1500858.1 bifunctional phosphopantothenoylcysteine decarboxylase/phosphopantothenate--cysteine ligase CoaBC [Xanthocytophaga agilis]
MLAGKKIILGITGSISAYKAALLTRLLVKSHAEVRIIMTDAATEFITPLTLSTLSKNPVLNKFVRNESGEWNNHVELGLWADSMIIAPASANSIAKCANGFCDNLLTATYFSARCPVFFAPAMDLDMYKHPATQANLQKLTSFGNQIIPAENGELASGLVGEGRLAEPEHIVSFLEKYFSQSEISNKKSLAGKKVLITAGPTYEPLDPVRFIGNHSTGKMGFAIAERMAAHGAQVELVTGPTHLQLTNSNIHITRVLSAQQMFEASARIFPQSDITVLAAAVADYRPAEIADQKIKKKEDSFTLNLVKNVDIAATLGQQKQPGQIMVGFALETENEESNAQEKLRKKNLDMIVLNSLNDKGAGFGHDTNKISVIQKDGNLQRFDLKSKTAAAEDITNLIIDLLVEKAAQTS